MNRTELREHIFKVLFSTEFNKEEEMTEQETLYFDMLDDVTKNEKTYILNKYQAVCKNVERIDEQINAFAKGWPTHRMNKVDLAILRLAVYEIQFDEDIPTGVAINEAVELAKKYSSDEGPKFINGILANFA